MQNDLKTQDEISFGDLFRLILKHKYVFLLSGSLGVSLLWVVQAKTFQGYNFNKNLFIKGVLSAPDQTHIEHLRFRLLNDEMLWNNIRAALPNPEKYTLGQLKISPVIKLQKLGLHIEKGGSSWERYTLAFYFRWPVKDEGQAILRQWIQTATSEIKRINSEIERSLNELENEKIQIQETLKGSYPGLSPSTTKNFLEMLDQKISAFETQIQTLSDSASEEALELKTRLTTYQEIEANLTGQSHRQLETILKRIDSAERKILAYEVDNTTQEVYGPQDHSKRLIILIPLIFLLTGTLAVLLRTFF